MEQEESVERIEIDKKQVKKVVRKILEETNLYEMTEKKVRDLATVKLGVDLSDKPYRSIVRRVVEDFLEKASKKLAQVKEERSRNAKLLTGMSAESK